MTSRITITIPADLVAEADEKAVELDRSRSWLLVEALRRYLAEGEDDGYQEQAAAWPGMLGEAATTYLVHGLGAQRVAQLRADLSLDPEERVRAAEDAARAASTPSREAVLDQVITFPSIEAFHAWERREALGRAASQP